MLLTYRVFARILQEHLLEIGAANGQDDLMCLQQFAIAGQGHVHQVTAQEQPVKTVRDIILEILPTQSKLLHIT